MCIDASDIGIGGVFTLVNEEGIRRPIKLLSRKCTPTENKHDSISKELLVVVYIISKLRKYTL